MNVKDLVVDTPSGAVSGLLQTPTTAPIALLVTGHGAGAGMRHHFMEDLAGALAAVGVATLRYQFPFMESGKFRTDPPVVAVAAVAAAVAEGAKQMPGVPLFAGGKSFGGRMTTTAASQGKIATVQGVVLFGFPLHSPKKPAITRAEHLDQVSIPMLFLQGTRDDLADAALMRSVVERLGPRATLHEIAEANHAFEVPKRTGKTSADIIAELAGTASNWLQGVIGSG